MKFSNNITSWLLASCSLTMLGTSMGVVDGARDPTRLRGGSPNKNTNPDSTTESECTIQVTDILEFVPGTIEDLVILCEDSNGLVTPVTGSKRQMSNLKKMVANGDIKPARSRLDLRGKGVGNVGNGSSRKEIVLGADFDPKSSVRKNRSSKGSSRTNHPLFGRDLQNDDNGNHNRHLLSHEGVKPTLVVRVTDMNGLVRPESAAQISDDIFGTNGDTVNLKSQLEDCSMGKLTLVPGDNNSGLVDQSLYVAPGVIEVTIPNTDLTTVSNKYEPENAVTAEVQAILGFNLPGPYEQVLYVLEGCYVDCGWAAYAYINGWNSIYHSSYYKMPGVLVHEVGHNLGLAHSGGLNGAPYSDHTGMMGNPLFSDDIGKMCYNAAKNWQLSWYNDRRQLLLPLDVGDSYSETITMVGIADYLNNPNGYPVVLKLETNTPNDYFIAFNRAAGVNAQNAEADDLITIVKTGSNGEYYSQSWLQGYIGQDESFTIENFAGFTGKNLIIEATNIDITSSPGTATITVRADNPPTSSPSITPPTSSPTICNGKVIEVDLTTDNYPSETSWTLINTCTQTTIVQIDAGAYTQANAQQPTDLTCVEDGAFEFVINDGFGDGICCSLGSGSYTITYDGVVVGSGGDFTTTETVSFGTTCGPSSPTPEPSSQPTPLPTFPTTCGAWEENHTVNYPNVCNGNGGDHGWAGMHTTLAASGFTKEQCHAACQQQGPGCCESRAWTSGSVGSCLWKSETTRRYSDSHTDTRAVVCSMGSASPSETPQPTSQPTPLPTSSPVTPPPTTSIPATPPPTSNPVTPLPTNNPTSPPTPQPSSQPTPLPTSSPVTPPPTTSIPATPPPTSNPVTPLPTNNPTSPPTPQPTNNPSTTAPEPCIEISVQVQTDDFPEETSWTLTNQCTGALAAAMPPQVFVQGTVYMENTYCLPPAEYTFAISDSNGDGICCGRGQGSFEVDSNGVTVAQGGQFGNSETVTFGSCPGEPTTPSPTPNPTSVPTNPVTPNPTSAPSPQPVTPSPTPSLPNLPTQLPTNGGSVATFDSMLGVPVCTALGESCTSGELLDGKAANIEPNPPNTLDTCSDGIYGTTYHNGESIDKITVSAVGGGQLQAGEWAEISALYWPYSTGSNNRVDFFYASDPTALDWSYIGTITPNTAGASTGTVQYVLPDSDFQAVRVQIRFSGSNVPCNGGNWDDVDDLVFAVAAAGSTTSSSPGKLPSVPTLIAKAEPFEASGCVDIDDQDRCHAASLCKWQIGQGCIAFTN